jgi:hypothetical protein
MLHVSDEPSLPVHSLLKEALKKVTGEFSIFDCRFSIEFQSIPFRNRRPMRASANRQYGNLKSKI